MPAEKIIARRPWLIPLALAIVTTVVYWHLATNDFTNFDDDTYITNNLWVQKGLTLDSIRWAFSFAYKDGTYWQPLTWLSLMLDYDLFKLDPTGYHLENLALHIANALLLFSVLKGMTGRLWQSAFVAFLFALHPLNVESVAWAVERKNVLSSLFWMLALWAYARYARRPSWQGYLPIVVFMAVGLMAKSMLVSLPCALLLLDYWPLRRTSLPWDAPADGQIPFWRAILEKVPLLALSLLSVAVSVGSLRADAQYHVRTYLPPLYTRISEALVSYAKYIGKLFWPNRLAVYYPPRDSYPGWEIAAAALLLVGITLGVIVLARKKPWLATGWLWFAGVLFPVSGMMRAGLWPAMADRFAYLPYIGLYIIVAWGIPELLRTLPRRNIVLAGSAVAVIVLLATLTRVQAGYWKTSKTLFSHALQVAEDNYVARNNYGHGLLAQGRTEEAIEQYKRALQFKVDYPKVHFNLGLALYMQGKTDEAIKEYAESLRLDPNHGSANNNLGLILLDQGKYEEAKQHFMTAARSKPNDPAPALNLGLVYFNTGNMEEARKQFTEALRLDPDQTKARANLGSALGRLGRYEEAIQQFEEILQKDPHNAEARRNLAYAQKKLAEGKKP